MKASDLALRILGSAFSITVGLLTASLIIALSGSDPLKGLVTIFSGGFSDPSYLAGRLSIYLAAALGFAIPARAGLFNVGVEGQVYMGALTSLTVSLATGSWILSLALGALAGGLLGVLAGALKAYRGINEVVSTIMLNWIFYYISILAVTYWLYDPIYTHQSRKVPPEARLPSLGLSEALSTLLLSLALALVAHVILYRTSLGYSIRVSGSSPAAAAYAGIDLKRIALASMALGGLFAGAGGALNVIGINYYIDAPLTSLYGLGFEGIGVSLIGWNSPLGCVAASLVFSLLLIGGQWAQVELGVPKELIDVALGAVVVSMAAPAAYILLARRISVRRALEEVGRGGP